MSVEKYRTEALKRLVFIHWYTFAEPSFLSGTTQLPKDLSYAMLTILKEEIAGGKIDSEFVFFLIYYLNIMDAYWLSLGETRIHDLILYYLP